MKTIDFLIIGAQKSGTSSLYKYLVFHSKIKGVSQKNGEIRFFDLYYKNGIRWYLDQFFKLEKGEITGEASANYLFPSFVPSRVKKYFPNCKIIILLRNPVYASYSQYQHCLRNKKESLIFKEALKLESKRAKIDFSKVKNNYDYESGYHLHSYTLRYIYIDQIRRWYEIFDKNQIFFESSERFFLNPNLIYNKILDFLGLNSYELQRYEKVNDGGSYPKMNEEVIKYLHKFFKPYNEKLYEFLKNDFNWEKI